MGDIAPVKKDYPEKEVASVAIFNAEGKLLFGQRRDSGKWTLPGGKLEAEERPERAAVRELLEEVGLTPESDTLELLGNDVVEPEPGQRFRIHAFRANLPQGQEVKYDNDPDHELQDHEWVDPEFIPKYILENLHAPKNVTLRFLGLQDWDEASGEGSKLPEFQPPHLQMQPQPVMHPATTFKSELEKGVMQRIAPFDPQRHRPDAYDEAATANWQSDEREPEDRNMVPGLSGTGRQRALHRLHRLTPVRWGEDGKREFLLHRGMSPEEQAKVTAGGGGVVNHEDVSSWTPRHDLAANFASEYGNTYSGGAGDKPGRVVSAWVSENAIHSMPKQWGALDPNADMGGEDPDDPEGAPVPNRGENAYAREHEVLVLPGHNSAIAKPAEVQPIAHPAQAPNLHERINIAGRMGERFEDERHRSRVTANRLRDAHPRVAGRQPPETNDPLERAERSHAPIELEHYSPLRGLKQLDPTMQGTGAFGLHGAETQRTNRIPRTYYYHAGTEPEGTFKAGHYQKYRAKLPPKAKLYDIGADPENLFKPKWRNTDEGRFYQPPDLDDIEVQIRKRGYHGYKNYHPSVPNAVAVFYPLKVTPVAKTEQDYQAPDLEKTDVEVLMQHPNRAERMLALKLPGVTQQDVRRGVEDPDAAVALAALRHPLVDPEVLTQALAHSAPNVRIQAAQHPRCDATHLEQALTDLNPLVRRALATSPNLTPDHIQELLNGGDPHVLEALAVHPHLTPQQAVAILVNPGVSAQVKAMVAQSPHLPKEMQDQVQPQLQHGFQRSAQEWLDMRKGHPTPTFPKMGKRAYAHLLAAAQTAPDAWAQAIQPWAQKLTKAEESVTAEAAHQTGLDVRGEHQDDKHVMPLADPDFIDDFEGHHLDEDAVFAAARFLSGGKARLPPEQMRSFIWKADGDLEAAALLAYGMPVDERHRQALNGVIAVTLQQNASKNPEHRDPYAVHNVAEHLGKAQVEGEQHDRSFLEQERPKAPTKVMAAMPSAEAVAEVVQKAYAEKDIEAVALKGKHTKGTMVAHDKKSGDAWLLKPGSGAPSPAKGIAGTQGTQSAREACFYACAKHVFGLEDSLPQCELLLVDGKPVAAMKFLPPEFKSLEKRAKEHSMAVLWSLHAYLKTGLLHKWAVMDWVLGNVDRHGQNILANNGQPERMYLIDHGSTFAGDSFDPAHDESSFVPYYLRAWAPRKFNTMPPEDKLRRMPRADHHVEVLLRDWVADLHAAALEQTMARFGLDPGPCLRRLAHVKTLLSDPQVQDFSQAIDSLWVG